MELIIYTVKDGDAYKYGHEAIATTVEPDISTTWMTKRRYQVPEGFTVEAREGTGEPYLASGGEHYAIVCDSNDTPVVLDHHTGNYISLVCLGDVPWVE